MMRETKASLRRSRLRGSWGRAGLGLSISSAMIWCLLRRCLRKLLVTSELYVSQCLQYRIFFLPLCVGSSPVASRVLAQVWKAAIPLVFLCRVESPERQIEEERSVSEAIDTARSNLVWLICTVGNWGG